MSRPRPASVALLTALVLLAAGAQAQGACTAGNPNANVIESTPVDTFTDNGDGTVSHVLSGLMWKQCVLGLSGVGCASGTAVHMAWSAALTAAVTDTTAGFSDWRLPNRNELGSLFELCGYDPAINQIVFPATPADNFWSASSYVVYPSFAWSVDFYRGIIMSSPKGSHGYVRLVRGGPSLDAYDAMDVLFANGFE